jgi:hypothetical protein
MSGIMRIEAITDLCRARDEYWETLEQIIYFESIAKPLMDEKREKEREND